MCLALGFDQHLFNGHGTTQIGSRNKSKTITAGDNAVIADKLVVHLRAPALNNSESNKESPAISDTATTLLLAAAKGRAWNCHAYGTSAFEGTISHSHRCGRLISSKEARDIARWKAALDDLNRLGYLKQTSTGIYDVTGAGFECAERRSNRTGQSISTAPDEAKKILETASKSSDGHVHLSPLAMPGHRSCQTACSLSPTAIQGIRQLASWCNLLLVFSS